MENSFLKKLLQEFLIILAVVCIVSGIYTYANPDKTDVQIAANEQQNGTENQKEKKKKDFVAKTEKIAETKDIKQKIGDHYIRIQKNAKPIYPVCLEDDYKNQQVILTVDNMREKSIDVEDISLYEKGTVVGKGSEQLRNFHNGIRLNYQSVDEKYQQLSVRISLDDIYGYRLYEDKNAIYIECCRPKEVYKRILVVDAGHGDRDTGTPALNGSWEEKDYNLDFVKRIEENWSDNDCKLYLSRWDDTMVSLGDRVAFANHVEADWFISVHCNGSDEGSGQGLEVLYKTNAYKEESKNMGKLCLKELSKVTSFQNRGLLDGQGIYIIRKAEMPMILVEMGFLSDKSDLAYLQEENNRELMAKTLCKAIEKGMKEIP